MNGSDTFIEIETGPGSTIPQTPNRFTVKFALFLAGFGTFVTLYATQPILPEFRHIFHASELSVSLTVSAPVLATALVAWFIGLLADALGRKRIIVTAMLGLSLPTLLATTTTGFSQLIFWRFLQGIFVPGIIAVTMAYISEETSPRFVGTTMATYVTGTVVGGFAGRFIAGLIATHWNWRLVFVFLGAISLLGALVTWWLLPRSTKFVRQRNASASLQALKRHLHNPQLWAAYVVGFSVLFSLVGTFTYINFYLADPPFHMSPTGLASIFAVYLIGAFITPVAGRIIDRIGYRWALIGSILFSAFGVCLTLIHSVPIVIAGLAICASGVFACQSAASSYVGFAAGQARSSATGLYVSIYYLGGCAGSIVPGLFWRHTGWAGCVALIILMQIFTAIIAYAFWKK